MLFTWTDDYSVRVQEVDAQHQELVRMINELFDAMQDGRGKQAVGRIIEGLIRYTQTHFATDEKYFDRFRYADAHRHKMEHVDFVLKVQAFHEEYTKGKVGLSISVMNFLVDWLKNHIQISDKKFGPVFNQNGLH